MKGMDRREFLKMTGAAGLSAMAPAAFSDKPSSTPPSAKGESNIDYADKPIDKVRVGVIGVGARGPTHINSLLAIEGVEIKAICDLTKTGPTTPQK